MTREGLRALVRRAFDEGTSNGGDGYEDGVMPEHLAKTNDNVFEAFWFREFPPKLSRAQMRMLEDVAEHGEPYMRVHGQSAHGGASATIASLMRLRLIQHDAKRSWVVTARGAIVLRREDQT